MDNLGWVLSGGWARGYRTYIMAGLGVATAVAAWSVGDQTSAETMRAVWEIFVSTSIGTARAAFK
jgi:hypothetical protein